LKTYVLDTSVLLYDPNCLLSFEDNEIVLPLKVIEELDSFKDGEQSIHRNAREVIRQIDTYRQKGKLLEGVELESGGRIRSVSDDKHRSGVDADTVIILSAREQEGTIVSKDLNMRIRAETMGVDAQDYEADKSELRESVEARNIYISEEDKRDLFNHDEGIYIEGMAVNEHAVGTVNGQDSVLMRHHADGLCRRANIQRDVYSIGPRNKEQNFALDVLLDPDVKLIVLTGQAGTGKTLISLAAGLQQTVNQKVYDKVVVARPIVPMGRDLGYLPGTVSEKMEPWMKPIKDNIDYLTRGGQGDGPKGGPKRSGGYEDLHAFGWIEVEPLAYIRGRSLPGQFLIIDEAQNLTPHEVKTIITRAGEGTKIVLTGDTEQIDSPYLNRYSNALAYVENRMDGEPIFASVRLNKGERSELAELAAKML